MSHDVGQGRAGGHGHGSAHTHGPSAGSDARLLGAALALIVAFMVGEVIAGFAAHSLALLTDAAHMITDAIAIVVALIAARIARRPARGAFTYGFARVDAISGQANGITLLLLAAWFTISAVHRLIDPSGVHGGLVSVVALIGAAVNVAATLLVGRADRSSLNIRGVFAHLLTDAWAFFATFVAGLVVVWTGWDRADPVASLVVAALMAVTGWRLVRDAGRVFLEAAPSGIDPDALGARLADVRGVAQLHDLHIWQIGSGEAAVSAHVLVLPSLDCHEVSARLRAVLAADYGVHHVTLQADHADDLQGHDAEHCEDTHGPVHTAHDAARPG